MAALRERLLDQAKGESDAGIGYFDGGEKKVNQSVWCLPNKGQEFIDLLEKNKRIDDEVPDLETMLSCSHTRRILQGQEIFRCTCIWIKSLSSHRSGL